MELRHLRYFVALAEQLNFTLAAEKVHVTQSTLSHQIKQLEDELGSRLFERESRKVTMTQTGEAFLERARNALREVDEGLWSVRMAAEEMSGVVRIGTTHTFNMRIIPRCISVFVARHPSVRVEVMEMSGDDIAESLARGGLDIGVTYKPQNASGLRFEALYTEEMMLAVGLTHSFSKRRFVRMSELHLQKVVLLPRSFATRALLDECFRMANATPVVVAEMNAIAPMMELVSSTDIAAIVSEHATRREDVRMIPVESPTPTRAPGLMWRTEESRSPAARAFASIIRSVCAEASHDRRRASSRAAARKKPNQRQDSNPVSS
ncbi:LysR substrate-binding domain-containing protein [Paraburkholderia sp. NPDC080076]|jgi:LysR family cyn operon transcriptional activator|uniref:LysR substrate-binding domain-containing protein n=1 Tax=Paraburkholderia sp. NPDC080076 TaxID=3390605 RepID=UPI003CFF3BBF